MFCVIAHYPPSDAADRNPAHRFGGSISYDFATRAEAQERYRIEAAQTHAIEVWFIGPNGAWRLNPFAWRQ
jgi:hypothetical protein